MLFGHIDRTHYLAIAKEIIMCYGSFNVNANCMRLPNNFNYFIWQVVPKQGKPIEKWGRKVSGLRGMSSTIAGLLGSRLVCVHNQPFR